MRIPTLLVSNLLGILGIVVGIIGIVSDCFNVYTMIISFLLILIMLCWVFYGEYYFPRETKMYCKSDSRLAQDIRNPSNLAKIDITKCCKDQDLETGILSRAQGRDKIIIQIAFVIMDAKRQVIVLKRKKHWHRTDFESILVSFSPFPTKYEQKLCISEIYHREIPKNKHGDEPEFKHLCNVTHGAYCFFVYVAEYNKLSFTEGESSKINKEIMERLFKTASGKYFLKDHDEISCVVTVDQLRDTPNRAEREMFIDAEVGQILSVRSSC